MSRLYIKCKVTGNSCHFACCKSEVEEQDTCKVDTSDYTDKSSLECTCCTCYRTLLNRCKKRRKKNTVPVDGLKQTTETL